MIGGALWDEPVQEDLQRHYDAYRNARGSGPLDFTAQNLIGYRSTYNAMARFQAGQGGTMVNASDVVAFSLAENGGPIDLDAGYVLRERETGLDFSVVECHNRPNGWLSATVQYNGSPRWRPTQVVP